MGKITMDYIHEVPFTPSGTHHNALDDAKAQAEHAVRLLVLLAELA